MYKSDILSWIKTEFLPRTLATPDATINQIIDNGIRYWSAYSAFPIVTMVTATGSRTQLPINFKDVVTVIPSNTPDWILQNYPLWSLLGITIIDNLTSDLVMLSEAYRNYKYYIGTDFKWNFQKSDNANMVGPYLYTSNAPSGASTFCVGGLRRIVNGNIQITTTGTSGVFTSVPITTSTFSLTNGTHTYIDNGLGILTSSLSGYSGVINYTTGVWSVTGWVGTTTATAIYTYSEDITSEFILEWLLPYCKALVKMAEGNTLRAAKMIKIDIDGQELVDEGKEEKKELETKLNVGGRWYSFIRKF